MLLGLGAEIIHVDIAARIARNHHDIHAGHRRRGRIGAVRGGGDQAHLAVRLAARRVITPDGKKARHIRPARRSSAAATPRHSR